MGGEAKGWMGAGGGRWGTADVAADAGGRTVARLIAPFGGRPPTGGGWWLYQRFSAHTTTLAPPFSLAHSASRPARLVPIEGAVSAEPSETPSHARIPTRARWSTRTTRRRVRLRGRRRRRPTRRRPRRPPRRRPSPATTARSAAAPGPSGVREPAPPLSTRGVAATAGSRASGKSTTLSLRRAARRVPTRSLR